MGIVPNNLIQLQTMNRKALFWPLAAMLLTACEKGLDEGIADVAPAGQAANSVLQRLPGPPPIRRTAIASVPSP